MLVHLFEHQELVDLLPQLDVLLLLSLLGRRVTEHLRDLAVVDPALGIAVRRSVQSIAEDVLHEAATRLLILIELIQEQFPVLVQSSFPLALTEQNQPAEHPALVVPFEGEEEIRDAEVLIRG